MFIFRVFSLKWEYVSNWDPSPLTISLPRSSLLPLTSQSLKSVWASPLPAHHVLLLLTGVQWHHVTYSIKSRFLSMMLDDFPQLNPHFCSQTTSFYFVSAAFPGFCPALIPFVPTLSYPHLNIYIHVSGTNLSSTSV